MTDKHIVPVDDLTGAVAEWRTLDKDALLDIGDKLNATERHIQLALGSFLHLWEERRHGDIKDMAERWKRKPQTLMNWKSVYKKTRNISNLPPGVGFSVMRELARIPEPHQASWITTAQEMKRPDLAKAISEAKVKDDWTAPAGDGTVKPPEPESPQPSSEKEVAEKQPEFHRVIGRLYWRKRG